MQEWGVISDEILMPFGTKTGALYDPNQKLARKKRRNLNNETLKTGKIKKPATKAGF